MQTVIHARSSKEYIAKQIVIVGKIAMVNEKLQHKSQQASPW
jgi:hypothetical protein